MSETEVQRWAAKIREISKLSTYNLFKNSRCIESYLLLGIPRRLVTAVSRFRTGSHDFQIEIGRHQSIVREDRLCRFCWENANINVVEDEYHVLMECSCYKDVRNLYIGKHVSVANQYHFVKLMQSTDKRCIMDVSNFIFTIFRMRRRVV